MRRYGVLLSVLMIVMIARPVTRGGAVVLSGMATYYNPGVMKQVIVNRVAGKTSIPIDPALLDREWVGYVAVRECDRIGERVWIMWPGAEMEGPFLIVDCANRADLGYLERIDFVVDVDWDTAQRHGMRAPVPVQIIITGGDHGDRP